jgi:hypothetical protein
MLAVDGFPTGVRVGADLLAWARLASTYQVAISTEPHAVFYLRGAYPSRPTRIPDVPDTVGEELARLAAAAPKSQEQSMCRYVAMWHRVRAIMFIYHGQKFEAIGELRRARRFAPADRRLYGLIALAHIPARASAFLLTAMGRWKARQRSR